MITLLKNKYTWIILVFVVMITYYQLSVWNTTHKLNTCNIDKGGVELSLKESRSAVSELRVTIKDNSKTISELNNEIDVLHKQANYFNDTKNHQIFTLRKLISNLNTPQVYNFETNATIHTKESHDENDTIYNIINNIGN